jgi:long-chain acyl-CoA synthetase
MSHGEYVAPGKIENVLLLSQYIAQAFVHGVSHQSRLIAVIVSDEDDSKHWFNTTNENPRTFNS